jgi:hypothetical protein
MKSPWSHVAIIMGDELGRHVIDATFTHGVSRRSLDDLIASSSKYEVRQISVPRPDRAYAFARRQLGKPYDTLGALGIAFDRNWQDDDSWFCSEFAEAALADGGARRFEHYAWRVTPLHSWMVAANLVSTST